ncbi:hypothetical protein K491DRAFT_708023 [Lophiostoma macrostomum CBS 122681]|uniref:Aminoglycoside phosphotransferase domain-containing protein n=1 Tax=Lophiostoma macrostomum CBS 122681 TaxID=1314788 RepID=A0A6A6ST54_9PLEO|nr:hypothetical protein K491DRAFT_708023 [Lophiostoma macrostomum CBS 122681]
MTYQFLKSQHVKNIPLLNEMKQLCGPTDEFQFTLMSRAKGTQLAAIWDRLSAKAKKNYAQQLTSALRELRQFTSPVPQRVDGGPLFDRLIGQCIPLAARCKTYGKTTEEWFAGMAEELRYGLAKRYGTEDTNIIDSKLQDLKSNFPDGAPYVLTHGDLNANNIMVHDGKIVAIIDWEHAGYCPWWVEQYTSLTRNWGGSYDLMRMVWAELSPELDIDAFKNKVGKHISPVIEAYSSCPIVHTGEHDFWYRRAFCKCKPWGGCIMKADWGAELKHSVDYSE